MRRLTLGAESSLGICSWLRLPGPCIAHLRCRSSAQWSARLGTSSKRRILESGSLGRARPASEEASEQYHRALLASMRDIVLVADVDGTVSYCSPSVESALGYRPNELTGTNERELIHGADFALHDNLVSRLLASDDPQPPIELRLHDSDGEWHWFEVTSTKMLDDPIAHGIVTTARNVTARKEAASALIDLSLRDPLTGLPNRISLMDRMAVALAHCERSCDVLAVLCCDLDGFKQVNDALGHNTGDDVLVQ